MTDTDWGQRWETLGRTSFLKQTQQEFPEKWEVFYDQVCHLWERMAGICSSSAKVMAAAIADQGIVRENDCVLEIGCGPGNLSLALAGRGCRVTAMDHSSGMIGVLKKKIRREDGSDIVPLAADWNTLEAVQNHDLAIAAFFPEAFCPQGVWRMEQLAKRECVLVLGHGAPAFPFYGQMWEELMDVPRPAGGDHLACAKNYLVQAGRCPRVFTLKLPAVMNVEMSSIREYYTAYFGMFNVSRPRLNNIIDKVFKSHEKNGRVCLGGQSGAALVSWSVPQDASESASRRSA